MAVTWDGLPIASDDPHGCTVVVRRGDDRFLVLHRAAKGADFEGDWAWTPPAGARLPGEPVSVAAARELHEEAGLELELWPVDLSGRWAVFAADAPDDVQVRLLDVEHDRFEWLRAEAARARIAPAEVAARIATVARIPRVHIGFRAMTRADLPEVVRWQAEPHVARWWSREAPDVAGAEAHYGPALDGKDPTRLWVVEIDGAAAGMVQDYRIGDHPEYALLTALPDAIGFDYLIGDPSRVGVGLGTRMLWAFLRDVVRPHYPDATTYFAAPDHRNLASLRVLDKIGCARGLWFDEPQPDGRVDTVVACTFPVARLLAPG